LRYFSIVLLVICTPMTCCVFDALQYSAFTACHRASHAALPSLDAKALTFLISTHPSRILLLRGFLATAIGRSIQSRNESSQPLSARMAQSHLNRNRSRSELQLVFVGLELQKLNAVLDEQVHTPNPRAETMPQTDPQLHRRVQAPKFPCHGFISIWTVRRQS
jgi:hypothetical protein